MSFHGKRWRNRPLPVPEDLRRMLPGGFMADGQPAKVGEMVSFRCINCNVLGTTVVRSAHWAAFCFSCAPILREEIQ